MMHLAEWREREAQPQPAAKQDPGDETILDLAGATVTTAGTYKIHQAVQTVACRTCSAPLRNVEAMPDTRFPNRRMKGVPRSPQPL